MGIESTGGTSSGDASGNPPVVSSLRFKSNKEILTALAEDGFLDAGTPGALRVLDYASCQHLPHTQGPQLPVGMGAKDREHGPQPGAVRQAHAVYADEMHWHIRGSILRPESACRVIARRVSPG